MLKRKLAVDYWDFSKLKDVSAVKNAICNNFSPLFCASYRNIGSGLEVLLTQRREST